METVPPGHQVEAGVARRRVALGALLRVARPKQWVKNVLVVAAPGAGGMLLAADVLAVTLGAFGAWCLLDSGVYFLNDAMDVAADRLHPKKRLRPVAAGLVPVATAQVAAAVLITAGATLPLAWGRPGLAGVLAAYACVQVAYCLWLKHQPVFELAAVASGFVFRAISGGVATGVPLSRWFLIVASAGSLFIVASKRYAEHVGAGAARAGQRAALAHYSLNFLRQVRSVATSVTVLAYCLWAFERTEADGAAGVWDQLSILPFVLALLRYTMLVEGGEGGAPEDLLLADRALVTLALAWAAVFALAVYAP